MTGSYSSVTVTANVAEPTKDYNATLPVYWYVNDVLVNDVQGYSVDQNSDTLTFTPSHGEIGVSIKLMGGVITVRVSDTGIGMSKEVASHVFDKYYQGDKSHSTRGNGLGLSIVKRIVTLSGGDVTVESKENVGSTFIVRLPV